MENQVILEINDFGPINDAEIELKKINVIAGNNSSGKSTSSKLLFCFLTAISKEGIYLANRSVYDRIIEFILNWNNKLNNKFSSINLPQKSLYDKYLNDDFLKLTSQLQSSVIDDDFPDKNLFLEKLNDINRIIELNKNDNDRIKRVIKTVFVEEFNFEFKKYDNTVVKFHGNVENCNFFHKILLGGISGVSVSNKGDLNCLNFENILYIDSASIFEIPDKQSLVSIVLEEENNAFNLPYHLEYLLKLLKRRKNTSDVYAEENNEKIEYIKNGIYELIKGDIYFDISESTFKFKTSDEDYSMKNTASGVKQLGVIPLLLENGQLKENCFLIMDEPEVNLHPEWQLRLAEILVLLARDANIHMYINSHSPHFIEALEVFSAKYGLVDDSKFYLSEELKNGKYSFREVKRKNLNILYDNLGNPYDEIDKIRMENVFNGIE